MNIILLSIFTITEVFFFVVSLKKHLTKSGWQKVRLTINYSDFVLFLLFALFPGIDFSFRYTSLVIFLVARIISSGIFYFAKRNNFDKKKIRFAFINLSVSLLLLFASFIPSFIFTDYNGIQPTGPYKVSKAEIILIDKSRVEAFENDGSFREIPLHFFYPEDSTKEKFPVVIFSHGSFGYYASNASTYLELASHGYIVISLDHPYHSFFCKDTNGKNIFVNQEFFKNVMTLNNPNVTEEEIIEKTSKWLKLRTEDISFVIDSLKKYSDEKYFYSTFYQSTNSNFDAKLLYKMDLDKISLIGHSLGGAASEILGRQREDIKAVVVLDGTMLGEQTKLIECEPYTFEGKTFHQKYDIDSTPYKASLLTIDNEEHHNSRIEAKRFDIPYSNNIIIENALDSYETYFTGSAHMNFTDFPLFSPFLAKQLGTGSIDAKNCIKEMNKIIVDFYDSRLKNDKPFELKEVYGY